MNKRSTVTWRGMAHYWKWNLGLMAGTALTAAILTGALLVGDSVKESLHDLARTRLGEVQLALVGGDRFVTTDMVERLRTELGEGTTVAPVMMVEGSATGPDGTRRVNRVNVVGVDDQFWRLGPGSGPGEDWSTGLAIGSPLAQKLGVEEGDFLMIRVELPGVISRDAPLSGSRESEITFRRRVAEILGPEEFGLFSLRAEQQAADNVFLPQGYLQQLLEREDRVNLVLAGGAGAEGGAVSVAEFEDAVNRVATLADFALQVEETDGGERQLQTERVFLDRPIADLLLGAVDGSYGVLTYLVNRMASSPETGTPYSMVTAVDRVVEAAGSNGDAVVINRWLADDQGIGAGDDLTLSFFVVGEGRELEQRERVVTVAAVLEMDDPVVRRDWTPDFPGVSDVDNCRDWEPGIPIDLDLIRDQDEDYWDEYRGTPKGFIPLALGQELWGNRFGDLTSVRWPAAGPDAAAVEELLRGSVGLAAVGWQPVAVADSADAAAEQSLPLGLLLLFASNFLILAALVLTGLLFAFTLQHRSPESGLMLAAGWSVGEVRRVVLLEVLIVAAIGAAAGVVGGLVYAWAALTALRGGWSDAVGGLAFDFHASPASAIYGWLGAVLMALLTAWWVARVLWRRPVRSLLAGDTAKPPRPGGGDRPWWRAWSPWVVIVGAVGGVVALSLARGLQGEARAGAFFGGGLGFLAAGLAVVALVLRGIDRGSQSAGALARRSLTGVALRNLCRRPGRSLAVAGVMAAGVFLVFAFNAFQQDAERDHRRDGGTGGFAFYGETALPLYEDLNLEEGREEFALDAADMEGVTVLPMRQRDGDDASCLNLNRAQQPVLLGVPTAALAERRAFTFSAVAQGMEPGWEILRTGLEDGEVPGVIDQNTAAYALRIGVGDTIEYRDGRGGIMTVRVVGLIANSIWQGRVLIDGARFVDAYPDVAGYRALLIDAPEDQTEELGALLTRQLEKRGLSLEPAVLRLARFNAVQNSYIRIFSVLGGLGVLLGTAGLALVVVRSVQERRGELGLMQAVGFRKRELRRMLAGEHVALTWTGVAVGVLAAIAAVWPQLTQPGEGGGAGGWLFGWLAVIVVAGGLFCVAAAAWVLRGALLNALRNE